MVPLGGKISGRIWEISCGVVRDNVFLIGTHGNWTGEGYLVPSGRGDRSRTGREEGLRRHAPQIHRLARAGALVCIESHTAYLTGNIRSKFYSQLNTVRIGGLRCVRG